MSSSSKPAPSPFTRKIPSYNYNNKIKQPFLKLNTFQNPSQRMIKLRSLLARITFCLARNILTIFAPRKLGAKTVKKILLAVAKSDSYARNENSYYLVDKNG